MAEEHDPGCECIFGTFPHLGRHAYWCPAAKRTED